MPRCIDRGPRDQRNRREALERPARHRPQAEKARRGSGERGKREQAAAAERQMSEVPDYDERASLSCSLSQSSSNLSSGSRATPRAASASLPLADAPLAHGAARPAPGESSG